MLSDYVVFLISLPLPMHCGGDYRGYCGNQWTEFVGHNHMLILSCSTQVLLILVLPDLLLIITREMTTHITTSLFLEEQKISGSSSRPPEELGHRIKGETGEPRSMEYLVRHLLQSKGETA